MIHPLVGSQAEDATIDPTAMISEPQIEPRLQPESGPVSTSFLSVDGACSFWDGNDPALLYLHQSQLRRAKLKREEDELQMQRLELEQHQRTNVHELKKLELQRARYLARKPATATVGVG